MKMKRWDARRGHTFENEKWKDWSPAEGTGLKMKMERWDALKATERKLKGQCRPHRRVKSGLYEKIVMMALSSNLFEAVILQQYHVKQASTTMGCHNGRRSLRFVMCIQKGGGPQTDLRSKDHQLYATLRAAFVSRRSGRFICTQL